MERGKPMAIADHGIAELGKYVDTLITIPNEKLLSVLGPQTTLLDAFREANKVLQGAVQGIAELITRPGLINVDFADVRTVMSEMGMAMMGTGESDGENRAQDAAEAAVNSPLLDDIDLSGANGILVNVTAGMDLAIGEFDTVGKTVKQFAAPDATVVVGTVIDPDMNGSMRVTVVATGLGRPAVVEQPRPEVRVVRSAPKRSQRPDWDSLEQPAVARTKRAVGDDLSGLPQDGLLDIPAFLRRQAD
jgi:cell division protein FtsZ